MKIFYKILFIFIILVILGAGFILTIQYNINRPASAEDKKVVFEIEKGEKIDSIAQNLKTKSLIRSELSFKIYLAYSGKSKDIQYGDFVLAQNLTTKEIVNKITDSNLSQNKITIIEGWRLWQIAQYLEQKGIVKENDFVNQAKVANYIDQFSFLTGLPQNASLEGFLFPDTYLVSKDTNSDKIIIDMLKNFDQKFDDSMQAKITEQNKTILQVIALASIVEREVPNKDDRAQVAGLYWNRLAQGMKLEADPTVQYAKDNQSPPQKYDDFWPKVTAQDYQNINSQYNTYQIAGLPPGPICNPGLDAIKTTIYYNQNDYLYFFNTKDGKTIYSKTNEEHEENLKKYL